MWYVIIIIVIAALGMYLKSPSVKGRRSEQAVARKLVMDSIMKQGGKIITNLYIPMESEGTSEIDVLYITSKGLIVIENKNYAGYIFGNEANKNWTVTLYAGKGFFGKKLVKKHHFYNPIWQNKTHIKYLQKYLGMNCKTFSLIAFSNRGELKDITIDSNNVFVCNHSKLSSVLGRIWNENEDILSDNEIDEINKRLIPLSSVNKEVKKGHIDKIHERFNSKETCPICGGKLILRTIKNGANVGNQFYGCSNYPKCRYTRNI